MIELEIYQKQNCLRSYQLKGGSYEIGNRSCDIELRYPTVSKLHGTLMIQEDSLEVFYRDSQSRNGSFFNNKRRCSNKFETWFSYEELSIGPFILKWKPSVSHKNECLDLESMSKKLAELYGQWLSENPLTAIERLQEEIHLICIQNKKPQIKELLTQRIQNEFHGNGPLTPFMENPNCKEILINDFQTIFIDDGKGPQKLETSFLNKETFEAWVIRTATKAGRRFDLQNPICEATLPDGARFHAVLSPISASNISVAIRKFHSAPLNEEQALESKWMSPRALELLKSAFCAKKNIVISGGTSSGKTSLLNFLCQYLTQNERIITIEDTVELSPPAHNLVQLQARTANADGVGQISLRQLVQCALRMRPDRIIVGECRGAEVIEMLQALNTGHPGSLTTVHANSTSEALQRLELLALLGASNLSIDCIREWIRTSVDVVVQLERDLNGRRYIKEIISREKSDFFTIYVADN